MTAPWIGCWQHGPTMQCYCVRHRHSALINPDSTAFEGVASCCGSAWPRLLYSRMKCNASCCIIIALCHSPCTYPLPLSCSLRAGPGLHSAGSSSQCMAVAHKLLLSGFAPVHTGSSTVCGPLCQQVAKLCCVGLAADNACCDCCVLQPTASTPDSSWATNKP